MRKINNIYTGVWLGSVCLLLLFSPLLSRAGERQFSAILNEIESNNPALMLYGKRAEARKVGNHTDLAPENPEVEFGLLPSTAGDGLRKDV